MRDRRIASEGRSFYPRLGELLVPMLVAMGSGVRTGPGSRSMQIVFTAWVATSSHQPVAVAGRRLPLNLAPSWTPSR